MDLDLAALQSAAALVHRTLSPTAQYNWPKLSRRAGCSVWVKHENHTPTGAFKVRGGLVYLERLRAASPKVAGVISATRGNHGQSIAYAAARARLSATIYVPHGNTPDQNSAIASFGARVVEFGRDFDESKHEAARVADAEGLHFVPAFHRDLVAGVASYALELFHAVGDLDCVYVGVGMGSIAEGAGAAPLAALLEERGRMSNKRVGVILSGGNIERARFLQVLNGATPPAA